MKKLTIAFCSLFLACGDSEKPADNPNNKKALEALQSEPKVKEAIITDANVLYVSVEDDGTNRKGYADYLCQVLAENGSTISWIKIVKVGSTNDPKADNAYGVLLGETHCK